MRDPDEVNPDEQLRIDRLQSAKSPQTSSEVMDSPEAEVSQTGQIGAVQSTQAAQSTREIEATGDIGLTNPLAELTRALATGAISPDDARERLVDQIVRSQLPADTSEAAIERIRSEVAEMLRLDPTVKALLTP